MSTILNKYIDPIKKTIFIGKEEWKSLNEQYDKDVIKGWIIEEIMDGNIGFPHMDIDINDAEDSFRKLCAYQTYKWSNIRLFARFKCKLG